MYECLIKNKYNFILLLLNAFLLMLGIAFSFYFTLIAFVIDCCFILFSKSNNVLLLPFTLYNFSKTNTPEEVKDFLKSNNTWYEEFDECELISLLDS